MKKRSKLAREFDRLSSAYQKALFAAYESESHFYANRPKSPELEKARMDAYNAFDKVRNEYLKTKEYRDSITTKVKKRMHL